MLSLVFLAALQAVGFAVAHPQTFHHHLQHLDTRSTNQVFTLGVNNNPAMIQDGIGAGSDWYTTYSGDGSAAAGWPVMAQWVSFEDMFNANKAVMLASCNNLGSDNGPDDSEDEVGQVWNAVQFTSYLTKVDHRFILAILLQESKGCVRVRTTNNGVRNPGLMQAHDGAFSCNMNGNLQTPCPSSQIFGMVFDGVGGTSTGDGLAGILNGLAGGNDAQVYYRAARQYNTGSIAPSGQLEDGAPSTNCYASDIANRLTGWVLAESTCFL